MRSRQATIVQNGSNDGKTEDRLYELFRNNQIWRGPFVETFAYLMEKLRLNYFCCQNHMFEEAVVNDGLPASLYFDDSIIHEQKLQITHWCEQLGSLNPRHAESVSSYGQVIRIFRRQFEFSGIIIDALLKKNAISAFDLLHIDVE